MQQGSKAVSQGIEITRELTIPKLFYEQAQKYGQDKVAMREKEFGIWRPITLGFGALSHGTIIWKTSNTLRWVLSV